MKTVVTAILGALQLIAGVALLVLPGPGFVLVAAGLAVLATRFGWARRPLDYAKDKAQQGIDEVARSKFRAALALLCALAWYPAFRRFDITLPLWQLHRGIGMGGDKYVRHVAGEDVEREHGNGPPRILDRGIRSADR